MNNRDVNKKMQSKLTRLCRGCELRKSQCGCPYSHKLDCEDYNMLIAKTVLTQYQETTLTQIPASALIKGLRAHKYVGDVIHYSCIDYINIPVEFFINGLRAYGYGGELRKTKTVRI